jgi:sugar phosphate isomerase/epimerase
MQLGFVSAILADQSLEQVFATAREIGYDCVEVMCWPPGKADRRYAGVCHIDVTAFGPKQAIAVKELAAKHDINISGLGYYPNPLDPDPAVREATVGHLLKVVTAAKLLNLPVVNTFIGRDPQRSIDDQWETMKSVWRPIVEHAEREGVRIAIENCPMLFSKNEWPGGKNLATHPAVWRPLFSEFPTLGLNFDPSHLVWQMIDVPRAIREFGPHIIHVHAKDARIDQDKLYDVGTLTDAGYNGPVCVEVEDRAFEKTLADRKRSLVLSRKYLQAYVG